MQSVLSRIWTRVAVSISYDDSHYTTGNECPGYDTKLFDGEDPVMLEFWRMWSTPSLPSLSGPLFPDKVLFMGQIKVKCVLLVV